jgi:alkylation response protein AidB-like acyl-CoA dehydrogenase
MRQYTKLLDRPTDQGRPIVHHERLYRDALMLLIGEGTAEIQKMIIGRRLLERYAL